MSVEEFVFVLNDKIDLASLSSLHRQEFEEKVIKRYGENVFSENLYDRWWHHSSN